MNLIVKIFLIILAIVLITIFILNTYLLNDLNQINLPSYLILKSKCECFTDIVIINQLKDSYHITVKQNNNSIILEYEIKDFKSLVLSCDLYKVLRRGPNQNIISFSLFGTDQFYYDLLITNIRNAKKFYKDWSIRVYHDNSINKSIICKHECLTDKENRMNNIDYCNINNIIYKNMIMDYNYMLPMTWRWLPIGDNFVNRFISRDTDSCLFERELEAVKEWIKSNSLFHIMRDAPAHGPKILGGMWGFFNSNDKKLGEYFYNIITSKLISYWYRIYLLFNSRGADQFILAYYFWPIARKKSTIHDSFNCERQDLGGEFSQPFPTQRPNFSSTCHVGALGCCDINNFNSKHPFTQICPKACRPTNHQDWIYC